MHVEVSGLTLLTNCLLFIIVTFVDECMVMSLKRLVRYIRAGKRGKVSLSVILQVSVCVGRSCLDVYQKSRKGEAWSCSRTSKRGRVKAK